jgi:hypothetical protein
MNYKHFNNVFRGCYIKFRVVDNFFGGLTNRIGANTNIFGAKYSVIRGEYLEV